MLLNIPGLKVAKMIVRETEGLRFCSFGHFMTPYQLQIFVYVHTNVCKSAIDGILQVGMPDFDSSLSPWQM